MKRRSPTLATLACAALCVASVSAWSQQAAQPADHAGHHAAPAPAAPAMPAANAAAEMASGEVRRIDKAAGKMTLRHGEIKSLQMPPMTMVFQVLDAAVLDRVKVGDKVRFRADQQGSAYRVIELQLAD